MINSAMSRSVRTGTVAFLAILLFFGMGLPAHAISIIRDAEIEALLRDYSEPLFVAAGLTPSSVDTYLVNDPSLNAFVAGGQNIFMHTGLIVTAENPNELVGVLAHETGHISGAHLARRSDAGSATTIPVVLSLGLGILAIAAGAPDAGAAILAGGQHIAAINMYSYLREQESSADQAGFTFIERAGQSPEGLVSFFDNFRSQEALSPAQRYPYFRTHPLSSQRIDALRVRLEDSRYRDKEDSPEELHRFRMAQAKLRGFLDRPESVINRYRDKDTKVARYAKAVAYFRMTEIENALVEMDALLEVEPENPYFHELRGQILFESGRVADAIPSHKKSVELAPKEGLLRVNLAQALIANPKTEGDPATISAAQMHLTEALVLDDENSFAWHQLAITYARQNNAGMADYATAERHYLTGNMGAAAEFASRAKDKLEKGTPDWNRAIDILNVARNKADRKRGHR